GTGAVLGGGVISGPSTAPNTDAWHQCPDPTWLQKIDTNASQGSGGLGEGSMTLTLVARNAAGVIASPQTTVHVDNQQPSIALSGPTDAPTTAGTQYVTATGRAGASGVSGVICSLDNAPPQWRGG